MLAGGTRATTASRAEEIVELIESRARDGVRPARDRISGRSRADASRSAATTADDRQPLRRRLRPRPGRRRSTASICRSSTSAARRVRKLRDELIGYQEAVPQRTASSAKEVDAHLIAGEQRREALAKAFNERFGAMLTPKDLNRKTSLARDRRPKRRRRRAEALRDKLIRRGRQLLRQRADRPGAVRADPDFRSELEGSSVRDGHAQGGIGLQASPSRTRASSTRRKASLLRADDGRHPRQGDRPDLPRPSRRPDRRPAAPTARPPPSTKTPAATASRENLAATADVGRRRRRPKPPAPAAKAATATKVKHDRHATPRRSAATIPAPAAAGRSTRSATGRTWREARPNR